MPTFYPRDFPPHIITPNDQAWPRLTLTWRSPIPITSLYFTDFGPFEEIEFKFDRQVNVFTGPNNVGKSAALLMLGELLVYPFGVPNKLYRSDSPQWKLGFALGRKEESVGGHLPSDAESMLVAYEAIGHTCFLPAQRSGTDFRAAGPSANQDLDARTEEIAKLFARVQPMELRKHGFEALRDHVRRMKNAEPPELKRRSTLALTNSSWVDDTKIVQKIIDLDYAAYRQD